MILRALIKQGADVNAVFGAARATPLHVVCDLNQAEDVDTLVSVLLASGADPNLQRKDDGKTALHLACELNRKEAIKTLVGAGADPLLPMSSSPGAGNTPLQKLCYSAVCNKEELMTLFIQAAKRPLTEVWKPGCWSALHDAAAAACPVAFKLLLEAGLDPDAADGKGATPLWELVQSPRVENVVAIIDFLVEAGVDLNKKRLGQGTILHYARSVEADDRVVQCLIKQGATDA